MMKTFKVYAVFDEPPEEVTIHTDRVAWVSHTVDSGMREVRKTCGVHFSGGGVVPYVIGTREEVSAAIDEANNPPLVSDMNHACCACVNSRHDRCERRYPLQDGVRAYVCYCTVCCWDSGRLEYRGYGGIDLANEYEQFSFEKHDGKLKEWQIPNPCPTWPSKFKPPTQHPDRPEGWCWTCASGQHGNGCEAAERFGQLRPDGTPWNMDHFCRCGCKKDRGR